MKSTAQVRGALPGLLPIAAVEREVGVSKDTLRVWERRYGFPQPQRDEAGNRSYPLPQVQRLRLVKRLLDAGYRPGGVVALPANKLAQLALRLDATPAPAAAAKSAPWSGLLDTAMRADAAGLRAGLLQALSRAGLRSFLTHVLQPLTAQVGQRWLDGALPVFAEHLYTQTVQAVLQHAVLQMPAAPAARPRILLATTTGEPHGLGLLMAQAMMGLEGCETVSLGVQTPPGEIVAAAVAMHVDVVALSFSACLPKRSTLASALQVRAGLPPATALWLGGRGAAGLALTQEDAGRMQVVLQLDAIADAAAHWRASHRV